MCQVQLYNFSMPDIGHSGIPLAKKLEIKSPLKLLTIKVPKEYKSWRGDLPVGAILIAKAGKPTEAAHLLRNFFWIFALILLLFINILLQIGECKNEKGF